MHMITVPTNGQAVNDESGEVNVAFDHDHEPMQPAVDTIPAVAKKFKARGQPWALIVDENYGEGSAREHAALQPRFYGRIVCFITLGLSLTINRLCNDYRAFVRPYSRNQFEGMTFILSSLTNRLGYERYLGNLQKQGILPLWFADKNDYSRIGSGAVIQTIGVHDLVSGNPDATVRVKVTMPAGESFEIATKHTMSSDQLKWLRAGSALNYIRSRLGKR